MALPDHKTRIVATIGPASSSPEMLRRLILAGMDIARLNFSHGEIAGQGEVIDRLRSAARETGRRLAILADLPGPKIRVGRFGQEPVNLVEGSLFVLTTEEVIGDAGRVSVTLDRLPRVVGPGDLLYLDDGLVRLRVEGTTEREVRCTVITGGELRSHKGLNLPGIDLGLCAFTEHDRACLQYALDRGVDAVSQSFVESAADIEAVRAAAAAQGRSPFIVAKIERAGALRHLDEILRAADGIMVARGDLGVEVPIEEIAVTQKRLLLRARQAGKPSITATQMLESMVSHRLPTRAEATDVANAILDGTDCLMLSAESAVGRYPEEAVAMLARIAACTEKAAAALALAGKPPMPAAPPSDPPSDPASASPSDSPSAAPSDPASASPAAPTSAATEAMTAAVAQAACRMDLTAIFVRTHSGATAEMISRFRLSSWTVAVSANAAVCQTLQFSYGVHPVEWEQEPEDWNAFAAAWAHRHGLTGETALLVAGPSRRHPEANHRLEFLRLSPRASA